MRKKRWIALIGVVAALLALAVLAAACDDDDADDGGGPTEPAATEPQATEPAGDEQGQIEISALNVAFDTNTLTVPAGQEFTVVFNNDDDGIQHSFAIYESQEAAEGDDDAIAATEIASGPVTQELTTTLEAGEYYFWCDVHQSLMSGTLIAE